MVQPVRPQRPPRTARFTLTAGASAALLALGLGTAAHAQATDTPAPQRVEVTGSAITRIDGETALPVQVISREEIVRQA
jgi:iron complex outermembrane receptor protein